MNKFNSQSGQTLIETLAAIFILVMGVTAAVGLAVYALATSTAVTKQIVGTGLAREGIEAVKNMRDSNWLRDTLNTPQSGTGCYDFTTGTNSASCYSNWLGKQGGNNNFYCINPSPGNGNACNGNSTTSPYYLGFDASTDSYWILDKNTSNYGLNFNDPDKTTNWQNQGFYYNDGNIPCPAGNSDFCRRIVISEVGDAADPPIISQYNHNEGPMLYVQSEVWWRDKTCPRNGSGWPGLGKCSIELDTYLTNWKNY